VIEKLILIILNDLPVMNNTNLYLNDLTLRCEKLTIENLKKDFQVILGNKKIYFSVESVKIETEKIRGYFLGRYFEAEHSEIQFSRLQISGVCLSLCGLTCPKGGIFSESINFQNQRISIKNPKIKILNFEIPVFFAPEKVDSYGRSPGLMNPVFSISKRNRTILGIEYFFPIEDFDFSFSSIFFQRNRILLGGINFSGEDFSFRAKYANPNIFELRHEFLFRGKSYHISSYGDIFTRDFIQNIPANIESAGKAFTMIQQESFLKEGRNISVSNYIYIFSEFLTRGESFSELILTYDLQDISISAGGIGDISYTGKNFSPLAKFLYSSDGFRISGKLVKNKKEIDESIIFFPYEAHLYLFSEDFLYPLIFSLSYSKSIDTFFTHIGLSLFSPDFSHFGTIPELGTRIIFGRMDTFLSVGGTYNRNIFSIFSDSGIILSTTALDIVIRNSLYKEKFLSQFWLSSDIFISRNQMIRNDIGILFSNQAPYFRGKAERPELFPIYRANFIFSDLRIQPSLTLYSFLDQLKPIQLSILLSYLIKKICSDFYANWIYNFTKAGETRISFGVNINL